jgi:outer membrane lipopolysaccharide assembly protein LptE/RlpB
MKRILPVLLALAALMGGAVLSGCGYHVAGKAELMPKNIHTIFIEPFHTGIPRADIPRLLSADLARELLSRTHYKLAPDRQQADAVLAGAITNFMSFSTTADPVTGRSTGAQAILQMNIYLTDRATGKSLYQSTGYEFRERYEISENAATYFDESGTAVQRVTRDAARSIVSTILENF